MVPALIIMMAYFIVACLAIAGMKAGVWLILAGWQLPGVLAIAVFGWVIIQGARLYRDTMAEGRRRYGDET